MLEAIDERLFVDVEQAAFEIDPHAFAEDAVDMLAAEGGRGEAVGDLVGNDGRLGRLRRERWQRQQGDENENTHCRANDNAVMRGDGDIHRRDAETLSKTKVKVKTGER
jgi:hypothetical protein